MNTTSTTTITVVSAWSREDSDNHRHVKLAAEQTELFNVGCRLTDVIVQTAVVIHSSLSSMTATVSNTVLISLC